MKGHRRWDKGKWTIIWEPYRQLGFWIMQQKGGSEDAAIWFQIGVWFRTLTIGYWYKR